MASVGPISPAYAYNDVHPDDGAGLYPLWNNPSNGYSSNNSYCDISLMSETGGIVVFEQFDFSTLPDDVTITGIKFEFEMKADVADEFYIDEVRARMMGMYQGELGNGTVIPTSDTYLSFGGDGSLWGLGSWSTTDIKDSLFGCHVAVYSLGAGGTCYIDHCRATVYFSDGTTTVELSATCTPTATAAAKLDRGTGLLGEVDAVSDVPDCELTLPGDPVYVDLGGSVVSIVAVDTPHLTVASADPPTLDLNDGVVANWNFDENGDIGSANDHVDSVGGVLTFEPQGSAFFFDETTNGLEDAALFADGPSAVDQKWTMTGAESLYLSSELTIVGWLKAEGSSGSVWVDDDILEIQILPGDNPALRKLRVQIGAGGFGGMGGVIFDTEDFSPTEWIMWALVYDPSSVSQKSKFSINAGAFVSHDEYLGYPYTSLVRIGCDASTLTAPVTFDEYTVWDKALTLDALEAMYLGELTYPFPSYAFLQGEVWGESDVAAAPLSRDIDLVGAVDEIAVVSGAAGLDVAFSGEVTGTSLLGPSLMSTSATVAVELYGDPVHCQSNVSGSLRKPYVLLGGEVEAVATTEGEFDKNGPFHGDVTAIAEVDANMTPIRGLRGKAVAVATVTGALVRARELVGSAGAVASVTGTLSGTWSFSGTVAAVSVTAGAATEIVSLVGTVTSVATVAGQAHVDRELTASINVAGSSSANLSGYVPLAGAVTAAASVSGDVRRERGLSSAVDGVATVSGHIRREPPALGTVTVVASIAGALHVTKLLAAAVDSVSSCLGVLRVDRRMDGAVELQSTTAAAFKTRVLLQGSASPSSSITAALASTFDAVGQVAGRSAVSGSLDRGNGLRAGVVGTSAAAGRAGVDWSLAAVVVALADTTARTLSNPVPVAGSADAAASIAGGLKLGRELAGQRVRGQSEVAAAPLRGSFPWRTGGSVAGRAQPTGRLAKDRSLTGTVTGRSTTTASVSTAIADGPFVVEAAQVFIPGMVKGQVVR